MRTVITACVLAAALAWSVAAAQNGQLPGTPTSVKFAVIGDSGNGEREQYEVGQQMAAARARFPFEFVIMLGDNFYGRQRPEDLVVKFERPYEALLRAGVTFYAALGNHDVQTSRTYKPFNMGGERYYTYVKQRVRFFVLDTNLVDPKQVAWFENALQQSQDPWKIVYFHDPLYSNGGRHGSNVELRVRLEPLLVKYGVSVVFASHDHVYERLTPQKGITYFVEGASGQLRKGDTRRSATTAAAFDQDRSFMLVEIDGDDMFFQTISRTGNVVDSGVTRRRPAS
jgi:predicted MPP superfamily phosphohydrolase